MDKLIEDNLYFLDFETGGLKPHINGVCSCYIEKYNSMYNKSFIFYPQKAIYNIEALRINRFTMKDLYLLGSSRTDFINEINVIAQSIEKKQNYIVLCAWNSEFDISYLMNIFKSKNKPLPCPIIEYDLMAVAKRNIKKIDKRKKEDTGVENYKLITIYKHYFNDIKEDKTHTADYDVKMLIKLYNKFKELGFE